MITGSRGIAVGVGLLLALAWAGSASASAPELLAPRERAIFRDGPVDVALTITADEWPVWIEIDGELAGPHAPWPTPSVRLEPGMHRLRVLDRGRVASKTTVVAVFPPKRESLTGRERNGWIAAIASLVALLGATALRRRGL